ncbi:MAG: YHYH protein [Pseudomonadota bacterium]
MAAAAVVAASLGGGAWVSAEGPPARRHTVQERGTLVLQPAVDRVTPARVRIELQDGMRVIQATGLPAHPIGRFPNRDNPHTAAAQRHRFSVPLVAERAAGPVRAQRAFFGVAVNGVPFEAETAEVWQGDRRSGWHYDALGAGVPLGLDENHAHVQPGGLYHYHAAPTLLALALGWDGIGHSPLIGWAADGFPIYLAVGDRGEGPVAMQSGWRLKPGLRPGGAGQGRDEPGGAHDGTFVEDYAYFGGQGTLDICNGAVTYPPDRPEGTYAYFITDTFPYVPRCWSGTPDRSFLKGHGGRHGPGAHARHRGPDGHPPPHRRQRGGLPSWLRP